MASAWVLALGISAGYLINKNLQMGQAIEQVVKAARTVPAADRYQDMNVQDLTKRQMDALAEGQAAQASTVAAWEAGPAPIQGVYLNLSDRGV
jgi:hypothetical protein